MVFDIVAIVSPAPGKAVRVEALLRALTASVARHEPEVEMYMAYRVVVDDEDDDDDSSSTAGAGAGAASEARQDGAEGQAGLEGQAKAKAEAETASEAEPQFVVLERYRDDAGFEAHIRTPHLVGAGVQMRAEGLLARPLNVMKCVAVAGFEGRGGGGGLVAVRAKLV